MANPVHISLKPNVPKAAAITKPVTTAATSATPFGYSQAQANAIVTALNAVVDVLQAYGLTL